jgi:hypothetical protein
VRSGFSCGRAGKMSEEKHSSLNGLFYVDLVETRKARWKRNELSVLYIWLPSFLFFLLLHYL